MNDPMDVAGALAVCLALLGVYDLLFATPIARWYSIHAFGNLIGAALALPAMYQWLSDPPSAMDEARFPTPVAMSWDGVFAVNSLWPTVMIVAQHIYHLVAFKDVRSGDVWHHLLFVPVIGIYGGLMLEWGPNRNCLGFFISGLPGGLDYLNLVLHKTHYMTKRTQRKLGFLLALCCRAPGLIMIGFTMYQAKVMDVTMQTWTTIVLIVGFSVFNALYYLQEVVGAYYKFCYLEDEKEAALRKAAPPSPRCAPTATASSAVAVRKTYRRLPS